MNKYSRHRARKLAIQAIYQWQFTDDLLPVLEKSFIEDTDPKKIDIEYFIDILRGVIKNYQIIDEQMLPVLDRKITELNPVELAALRLAIYELLFRPDVPFKVIINEALELTKTYGSIEGYKYVNGVLDKIAKKLRTAEQ